MSDRVLSPGIKTPPRLPVAQNLVGQTHKGNCEELGNSLAIQKQLPVALCEYW